MKKKSVAARLTSGAAVLGLAAACLCACDGRAADTAHPLTHRNDFVSFTYPGNWKVTDEQLVDYPYFTVVEDPGNAIAIVFTLEAADDIGLGDFIARHIDFFGGEMDKNRLWETGQSTVSRIETQGPWETAVERFSLKSPRASAPHTRVYRRRAAGDFVCYVVSQAPDADLPAVTPGFDQIAATLEIGRHSPYGVE